MEQTAPPQTESIFATEPVGKLILKFSIPCVISLLVSSLYNIVDQIFIGWGVGYLGNGATNVVFPITIIALALALMIGDGCASFLSLRLGEGKQDVARQGVGNAIVMVVVVSILLTVVFQIWIDPILTLFGATDALREYALAYGRIIGLSLPFMMIPAALNSMIRADGSPKYAMLSMILGAAVNTSLDPIFIFCFGMGVEGAAIATVIGQAASICSGSKASSSTWPTCGRTGRSAGRCSAWASAASSPRSPLPSSWPCPTTCWPITGPSPFTARRSP